METGANKVTAESADRQSIEAGTCQNGFHGVASTLPQTFDIAETITSESFPSVRNGKQRFNPLRGRRQHTINMDNRDQLQHMSSTWTPGVGNKHVTGEVHARNREGREREREITNERRRNFTSFVQPTSLLGCGRVLGK